MCPEICEGVHRRATSRARVGISSQVNPTLAAQTFEIGLSVNAGGEAAISQNAKSRAPLYDCSGGTGATPRGSLRSGSRVKLPARCATVNGLRV